MHSKTLDRRVKRTHDNLRTALVSLILERGWDAVNVMDICERADVGRSTFYLHFADKEDLLLSGFDTLLVELQAQRGRAAGTFAFVEGLVEHAGGNIKVFRAIVGRKSGQIAQRRMRDLIIKLVEADLGSLGVEAASRSATAKFVGGGLFELLIGWVEASRRTDPRSLVATFRRLAWSALGRKPDG